MEKKKEVLTSLQNDIESYKELIIIIVDYYAFKNQIVEDEDQLADAWKKNTKYEENNQIIPDYIDKLIEESFKSQLKKYI